MEWLSRAEYDTLVEVLNSIAFEKQVAAANALSKQTPQYMDEAQRLNNEAVELHIFMDLLKDIREDQIDLRLCTAEPGEQPPG